MASTSPFSSVLPSVELVALFPAEATRPGPSSEPVPRGTAGGGSAPAPPGPRPPSRRPVVAPLSPERYQVQFTADAETYDLLRRAQELLSHQFPTGDPAAVVKRALRLLVCDLERRRHGKTERPGKIQPRPGSRHVPSEVRRQVHARDGGQCTFVGPDGRRCAERALIELHHETPYAFGGQPTVEGIAELCATHNQYLGRRQSGGQAPANVFREARLSYGRSPPGGPSPGSCGGRLGRARSPRGEHELRVSEDSPVQGAHGRPHERTQS